MNPNFQNVPLANFPGVSVATLTLPPGHYIMHAKLRFRGFDTPNSKSAGCAFLGQGIGGLDFAEALIVQNGEIGTIAASLMDWVRKFPGDDPVVHVQCYGNADVHMINTQFIAVRSEIVFQH